MRRWGGGEWENKNGRMGMGPCEWDDGDGRIGMGSKFVTYNAQLQHPPGGHLLLCYATV